jgi:hypothetical protein
MRACAILLLSLALLGCDNKPEPTPLQSALANERKTQEDEADTDRGLARAAVSTYARESLPTWAVKGISLTHYSAGYLAYVDTGNANKESKVVELTVRRFIAEDGTSYWKAELSKEESSAPQQNK